MATKTPAKKRTVKDPETGATFEVADPPAPRERRASRSRLQGTLEALHRAAPAGEWIKAVELGTAKSAASTASRLRRAEWLPPDVEVAADGTDVLVRVVLPGEGEEAPEA
jgi:hypothetical protein